MNIRDVATRVSNKVRGLTAGLLVTTLAASLLMGIPIVSQAEMDSMAGKVAAGSDCNPAIWKRVVKDNYAALLEDVKSNLEVHQFTIVGEHDLAKALATNREVLGKDEWNTVGFSEATALHFCSLVFNKEVFNKNMDYSILCPFKVVLYSMEDSPEMVTVIMVRPTYLLAHYNDPTAYEVGRKIESRILSAIEEVLPH